MSNDSTAVDFGINLLEEEIDDVIFRTNEFLTDATFTGGQGPFWWILQMSMALAGLFAIIMCANMTYKMMVKREPLDVMKLFKPLAVSIILCWWYPPADTGIAGGNSTWCALDFLSYVPNAIGSYTHDLYENEAAQVEDRMKDVQQLMFQLGEETSDPISTIKAASNAVSALLTQSSVQDATDADAAAQEEKDIMKADMTSTSAGLVMMIDKVIMLIALITFRIGWWGTIYCQQILLGMLTIFGPIQWAFSLLPKWEGAWAKWIIRYLTVHFYGSMLYFVGFYVLLLFDIVINIQYNDLAAVTATDESVVNYLQNSFFSAGYLMAASVVALKCLNLVPDLAAWMIPEGETAFSTRSFGEGIATSMRNSAGKVIGV
ncbi:hypothetical protein KSW89_03055 [Prevotella copri]|jgi:hypothetical protein|uniref:Plasmid transfer protein n=1 Tax=Segatella copri TaxID=165179 RepID=A0AAW4N9F2_9BACT|nr:hypothetical protein [Segatella copri]MBU9910028.1 hypothetical protein [Segatella copri]MBV3397784.1 hypothetical protein [Segatella copri]MBV3407318.1 hypothetical protein [Segatella copri]MBV3410393.1 hypothetical protein [Segatella copri]MBV3418711.1 hypothetical protein [Segatella copri]